MKSHSYFQIPITTKSNKFLFQNLTHPNISCKFVHNLRILITDRRDRQTETNHLGRGNDQQEHALTLLTSNVKFQLKRNEFCRLSTSVVHRRTITKCEVDNVSNTKMTYENIATSHKSSSKILMLTRQNTGTTSIFNAE